jgi:hypothetical protein
MTNLKQFLLIFETLYGGHHTKLWTKCCMNSLGSEIFQIPEFASS